MSLSATHQAILDKYDGLDVMQEELLEYYAEATKIEQKIKDTMETIDEILDQMEALRVVAHRDDLTEEEHEEWLDKAKLEMIPLVKQIQKYQDELLSIRFRLNKALSGIMNATHTYHQITVVQQVENGIEQSIIEILNRLPEFVEDESEDDYCKNEGSLNEIVFKMINHSSPPGSPSYTKMHRILYQANAFYINLGVPIFDDVAKNIATMLKGFGLQQEPSPVNRNDVLHIETSVKPRSVADGCTESPRIVIQTEQLNVMGKWYVKVLRDCHSSQNCIIWEFSDLNYEWEKRHDARVSDSVVLLPILIQSRLTKGQQEMSPTSMKLLKNRSLDVVFFAYMLERRIQLRQDILDKHANWNIKFEDNAKIPVMVDAYQNAKVCLVAHAYHSQAAGEYHRLSEFATMGCVPVMEEFADTIAIDDYAKCGGVVFASYESLMEIVETVLKEIDTYQRHNKRYVEWWKRGIQWDEVLARMFCEREAAEAEN